MYASLFDTTPITEPFFVFFPSYLQALGLACEKAEPDVMLKPPVEKGKLLVNRLLYADTLWYGCVMGLLG